MAAADLAGRRGGGGDGADQLFHAGARKLRLLLRRHRCIGPIAGAGERKHPELHRHAARDGEAVFLPRRFGQLLALADFVADHPEITFTPVLSHADDDADWTGARGFVQCVDIGPNCF